MDITITLTDTEVSALADRAQSYAKDGVVPLVAEFFPAHVRQLVLDPMVASFLARQKTTIAELYEKVDQVTRDTVVAVLETAVTAQKESADARPVRSDA